MAASAELGKHSFYRHSVFCGGVVEGLRARLRQAVRVQQLEASARVLLLVIARRPEVVDEALAAQAAE